MEVTKMEQGTAGKLISMEEHTHDQGHDGGSQQEGGQWDDGTKEEWLKQLRGELKQNHRLPSIFAYPFSISSGSNMKFHYLPEFVRVGLYRYDNESLISSQWQKDAAKYLTNDDFLSMVKLFKDWDEEIQGYYYSIVKGRKQILAQMMATDACFVSEWLYRLFSASKDQKPEQNTSSTSTSFTVQDDSMLVSKIVKDIIKLPCQIPLPLVKEAFRRAFQLQLQLKGIKQCSEEFDRMVNAFCYFVLPLKCKNQVLPRQHLLGTLDEYVRGKPEQEHGTNGPKRTTIQHLLHRIKMCCEGRHSDPVKKVVQHVRCKRRLARTSFACSQELVEGAQESAPVLLVEDEDHLNVKFHEDTASKITYGPVRATGPREVKVVIAKPEEEEQKIKRATLKIPSAAKLSKAGIRFTECHCGIASIKYDSSSNSIKLPKLVVDDICETVLHNLIAYEFCLLENTDKYKHVTGFCHLMRQLLRTKKDVAVLQSAGLLHNKLGDDDKVLRIWKSVTDSVHVPSLENIDIMKENACKVYKDRKVYQWCSEFSQSYCSRPWLPLSAIAAVLILCMTFLQVFALFCPSCLVVRK